MHMMVGRSGPNDLVFISIAVLTLIGGDIVQCALAALTSPSLFTPVAFSFGWVAYAFSAILAVIGDGRLMPAPDCAALVINADTGYSRTNNSWVLGRLVRDYDPPETENPEDRHRGLTVAFHYTDHVRRIGVPDRDWVYWSGVLVMLAQLGVACVPGALYGNWVIFILTGGGTVLALAGGALPQWAKEKWAARKVKADAREVVCLTRGNGDRAVQVIVSDGCGLKLEDVAAARDAPSPVTVPAAFALAVLWIVHLLTVEAVETDAWYSICIGAMGMMQNAVAAGVKRRPGALGFHFKPEEERSIWKEKVFAALQAAEGIEPGVGLSLLPVFFPGGLRRSEEEWRDRMLEEKERRKGERKAQMSASDDKGTLVSATETPYERQEANGKRLSK
ncbi:hypothetical protein WOLCODRAFT_134688 [Wolfiporia cocos MD-104 SS10]|uniref:Uncharacterized protein n=1 Tax=Wolfiporia cocos (strain MD-104) TaxID=742152 RepID=A0A2H3JAT4_WOLCO|nr:hypothetical protein WOLCODRAFT_134688 [Wolfiporia cocos MD-104 SS10]